MRRKIIGETGYYHLMTRTVGGTIHFGERDKEVLRKMIWQVAEFSGIRLITYAIMKNHFHLLVEVPEASEVPDKELVRRYRVLYPKPTPWQPLSSDVLAKILDQNSQNAERLRNQLLRRMHDVSWMMKTLKQRFSLYFNKTHRRFGTLWAERFKSVLVEGDRWALKTVSAYIDLNPVRAGIVEDPKDYRFSGYGEATGRGGRAKKGLLTVDHSLAGYRQTLFGSGWAPKNGKVSMIRSEALRVLQEEKGKLPLSTVLRCRVRYFTDGIVLGSPQFVERQLQTDPTSPSTRKKAHPMQGSDWRELCVATGLRKDLFK